MMFVHPFWAGNAGTPGFQSCSKAYLSHRPDGRGLSQTPRIIQGTQHRVSWGTQRSILQTAPVTTGPG